MLICARLTCHTSTYTSTLVSTDCCRIHPRYKEDIALRLSLGARNLAYGQDVEFEGPFPSSYTLSGNRLVIEFDNGNANLDVRNTNGFEVSIFENNCLKFIISYLF